MVALPANNVIRHLPIAGAVGAGVVAAGAFLLMPADMLEALVWHSGVAALVPVAQPPLGTTARAILALSSGVLSAAVVWSALYLLFGHGGLLARPKRRDDGIPVIRRADAHPDAPPRKPLSAADLGLPMMAPKASPAPLPARSLPSDLDQPLAAFDPHAILPVPMAPVRPLSPLMPPPAPAQVVEAAPQPERIETFDLPPIVPTRPVVAEPGPPPSIEALLRRLEQGAGRRREASAG